MKSLFLLLLTISSSLAVCGQNADSHATIMKALAPLGMNEYDVVKESTTYSIVSGIGTKGFVIVSLVGESKGKVIGYSNTCNWDDNKIPPVIQVWLHRVDSLGCTIRPRIQQKHNESLATEEKQYVTPLLTCHWHQNSPYNDLSPVIKDGNVKTVAGCVAIAAAQIVYYWRRDNPEATLQDTPVYPYGAAPVTVSIPQNTPNNWNLIHDSYFDDDSSESRYAVAQLCYVVGTSSYLNYASSTGGQIFDAANAIYNQFLLRSKYATKSDFSQEEWEALLYKEVKEGRPVMCSGQGFGGHAFVLDGYDNQLNLFHFNFGWGGEGDGYYAVDDSDEAMGGYFSNQSVVYEILPCNRNIDASMSCEVSNEQSSLLNVLTTITNKGTLPVRQLSIYCVPANTTLAEMDNPVWQGGEVNNDGIDHEFSVILEKPTDNFELFLTDEHKNELAHYKFNAGTGMCCMASDSESQIVYNLYGQQMKDCKKGINIIVKGLRKYKILK